MNGTTSTTVVKQRKAWDCGVAALAMLLNIPYADVSQTVRDNIQDPKLKTRGLLLKHVEQIIKLAKLPCKRVYRKEGYLEGATGILGLNGGVCAPHGHWVFIKNGMILDTDGTASEPEDYFKEGNCQPATLVSIT